MRKFISLLLVILLGIGSLKASYDFPNSGDMITFGTTQLPGSGTISGWISPDADLSAASATFFHDATDANNLFEVSISGGFWVVGWYTATVDYRTFSSSSIPSSIGANYNIVYTWDGALGCVLYINGASVATSGVPTPHVASGQKTIGNHAGGFFKSNSKQSYWAIWSTALTAANAASLAAGACPTAFAVGNRVNYWTLVAGNVLDQWNTANGTVTGATSSGVDPTVCAAGGAHHSSLLGIM
jgi:hypothetical protein